MSGNLREKIKRIYYNISPTYRTMRRIELKLDRLKGQIEASSNRNEAMFWWAMNRPGESMHETKCRIFESMPAAEGKLRKIQLENLQILKHLKAVCEEKDIPYWLSAGTLLGAFRHKGFIPWDDDIDIGMMRDDFDSLKNAMENDPAYELIPYYRTDWKSYIFKMVPRDNSCSSWIDILLYDYVDASVLGPERTWDQIQRIRSRNEKDKEKVGRFLSRMYHNEPIFGEDRKKIEAVQEKNLTLLPRGGVPTHAYRSIDTVYIAGVELIPITDIFPLSSAMFEGEYFSVKCKSEDYLMRSFKDFMRLPQDVQPSHID